MCRPRAPEGRLWRRFDKQVMVECAARLAARDYWGEWRKIRCLTLVTRGERGNFDKNHVAGLAHALQKGQSLTLPKARHDVHLDAPKQLAHEVRRFLG